jgi:hypothetical protein
VKKKYFTFIFFIPKYFTEILYVLRSGQGRPSIQEYLFAITVITGHNFFYSEHEQHEVMV